MALKLLMIFAVLLVLTWQSEAAFIANITLEDGLRLEADKSAALSINKTTNISSETDGQLNEVAIWTDPHAHGKCPRPKRLLVDYLKQLQKSVCGSYRYIGFISADAFISVVGLLSAIVILVLPAAANAIGFERSGVKTPSWASLIQTALFRGQISGKSGLVYSRLQSIGRRRSLHVMDQLFVTSVCAVIVFSYIATTLLWKVVSFKNMFITALSFVIVLLIRKISPHTVLVLMLCVDITLIYKMYFLETVSFWDFLNSY